MGRHVNADQRFCDGLGRNKIVKVGKKSGPVLSRLWAKVREMFGQCRRPFILSNAFDPIVYVTFCSADIRH